MNDYIPSIEELHFLMRYQDGVSYLPFKDFLSLVRSHGIDNAYVANFLQKEGFSSSEIVDKNGETIFLLTCFDRLLDSKNDTFLQTLKTQLHKAYNSYIPDTMILTKTNVLEYFISHPQRELLNGKYLSTSVSDGLTDIDRKMLNKDCLMGLWFFEMVFGNNDFKEGELIRIIKETKTITYREWGHILNGKSFLLHQYGAHVWSMVQSFLVSAITTLEIAELIFLKECNDYLKLKKEELQLTQDEFEAIGKQSLHYVSSKAQTIKDSEI